MKLHIVVAVAVLFVASAAAKKPVESDFPLVVEVESFETRTQDNPLYYGRIYIDFQNEEALLRVKIDGANYMLDCVANSGPACGKLMPGKYAGRWGKRGLEIFTMSNNKPKKWTYRVVSAGD